MIHHSEMTFLPCLSLRTPFPYPSFLWNGAHCALAASHPSPCCQTSLMPVICVDQHPSSCWKIPWKWVCPPNCGLLTTATLTLTALLLEAWMKFILLQAESMSLILACQSVSGSSFWIWSTLLLTNPKLCPAWGGCSGKCNFWCSHLSGLSFMGKRWRRPPQNELYLVPISSKNIGCYSFHILLVT